VIGHIRSRFSTHLPADTPARSYKIARKSFPDRTLPVSIFAYRTLGVHRAVNPLFSRRGEGVTPIPLSPDLGSETRKADPPVAVVVAVGLRIR
jgi:hypothetical protein